MTSTEIIQSIQEWAKSLIILQYRASKKNQAFIDLLVEIIFCNALVNALDTECLSVDNSVGLQLTTLGEWVGADRFTGIAPVGEEKRFSYPTYHNIQQKFYYADQYGFATYKTYNDLDGSLYPYWVYPIAKGQTYYIGDTIFRQLVKLKIIQNSINMTRQNIDEAIYYWSNNLIYTQWDTMQLTYISRSANANYVLQVAQQKGYLPAPCGVSIDIIIHEGLKK